MGKLDFDKAEKRVKKEILNISGDKVFIGIDPSLNGTGIVVISGDGKLLHQEAIILNKTKATKVKGFERLDLILSRIKSIVSQHKGSIELVLIEGYSFGSKGRSVFDLGELGGVIKYFLFDNKISFIEIPPKYLKKHVTGNGNADKIMMMESVKKKHSISFSDDNICDAYALARLPLEIDYSDLHILVPKGRGD